MLQPTLPEGTRFPAMDVYELLTELLAPAETAIETNGKAAGDFLSRAVSLLPEMAPAMAAREGAPTSGGLAPWQAERLRRFVTKNLAARVNIPVLAELVHLSSGHFARAFKASFGMTPQTYLAGERIKEAKRLMVETDMALSQIALECGMADQAQLCHAFRKVVGTTPAAWRRRAKLSQPHPAYLNACGPERGPR